MTSSVRWKLDQLKSELRQRPQVKSWSILREHVNRRERYFLSDQGALAVDQDRDTSSEATFVRLMVTKQDPSRQGEILKQLDPLRALGPQLDAAILAAAQTDHEAWKLPAPPSSPLPELKTADPRMAEDLEGVMRELTSRLAGAVAKPRKAQFNSAELFLSLHQSEMHLSNGMIHRNRQSRIYAEAAFSGSGTGLDGKPASDEYLTTQWAVSLDHLDLDRLMDETAFRAENSVRVGKPLSGHYPVVVDSEVLALLIGAQLSRLSGSAQYNRLPHVKPGDFLVPGAEGDLLTMTLDPSLDFGADTTAVSGQGVIQKPLKLVEKNQVLATAVDSQYAQYLGLDPTTARGNWVVEGGQATYEELLKSAPQVLEVLQFSSIFPDENAGTFSSEIRLARLHDNQRGTVSWIKGGSVSGSVSENFKKARFTRETTRRASFSSDHSAGQGYLGPTHALLNDVSVVG